jgi:hypothetical protein
VHVVHCCGALEAQWCCSGGACAWRLGVLCGALWGAAHEDDVAVADVIDEAVVVDRDAAVCAVGPRLDGEGAHVAPLQLQGLRQVPAAHLRALHRHGQRFTKAAVTEQQGSLVAGGTLVSSIVATQPRPNLLYSFTRSTTALCDSWSPWDMFSLATFMPASASSNSFSRDHVAGPMVHTIFVLRRFSYVSSAFTSELRSSSVRACGRDLRRLAAHQCDVEVVPSACARCPEQVRIMPLVEMPMLFWCRNCLPVSAHVSVEHVGFGEQAVHGVLIGLQHKFADGDPAAELQRDYSCSSKVSTTASTCAAQCCDARAAQTGTPPRAAFVLKNTTWRKRLLNEGCTLQFSTESND